MMVGYDSNGVGPSCRRAGAELNCRGAEIIYFQNLDLSLFLSFFFPSFFSFFFLFCAKSGIFP